MMGCVQYSNIFSSHIHYMYSIYREIKMLILLCKESEVRAAKAAPYMWIYVQVAGL